MADVALVGVTKVFPNGVTALRDLDLRIADGELFVIVGPSGSGKTEVLRLIAGLDAVTSGRVLIGGRDMAGVGAADRDVAMVFESDAVYPHLTVYENLAFGLRQRRAPRAEIERRVARAADRLGLTPYLHDRPDTLSGAHRQAVAVGRAIVRDVRVLLLDEPLSHIDPVLRAEVRAELVSLQQRLGTTTVLVTEHEGEAMTMAHRLAVLRDGVVAQVGRPDEVYRAPASAFVATFFGSPAMNLALATVERRGAERLLVVGGGVVAVPPDLEVADGQEVVIGVRASDLRVVPPGQPGVPGLVDDVEVLGGSMLVRCALEVPAVSVEAHGGVAASPDGERAVWAARADLRAAVTVAEWVTLVPDPGRVHLFDPATGAALTA